MKKWLIILLIIPISLFGQRNLKKGIEIGNSNTVIDTAIARSDTYCKRFAL